MATKKTTTKKPSTPAEPNTFVRVDFPGRETVVEVRAYDRGPRGGCNQQQKLNQLEWVDLIQAIGELPETSVRRAFRSSAE